MASKDEIIAKTNAAREARKLAREREAAAIKLQKSARGWLTRLRIGKDIKGVLDDILANEKNATSIELFKAARNYLLFCSPNMEEQELDRAEKLARVLVLSLDHDNPKKSYVAVALNKDLALAWISHMKTLLEFFCRNLNGINIESTIGQRQLSAWLGALIAFTATTTWKVFQKANLQSLKPGMEKLCQTFLTHLSTSPANLMQTMKKILLKGLAGSSSCKSSLRKTTLTAIMTLVTRPTASEKHLSGLILHILSVPGLSI